ncbi:hypothetical protein [Brevibacterium sp. CFH 10365]|uniref:hypothetical protein n=1 Tax=Brevibacterium sp. CFH 10365 TaxID=2585207 RepID=UPI0012665253|nr:hypothetical protein [Brevibacterium sp. CFH 10365]
MPRLTLDPTDPELDLTQYDPEALVFARVEVPLTAVNLFSAGPKARRDKVESDILSLLNEDQKERRAAKLAHWQRMSTLAAKELLRLLKERKIDEEPWYSQAGNRAAESIDDHMGRAASGFSKEQLKDMGVKSRHLKPYVRDFVEEMDSDDGVLDKQQVLEEVARLLQMQIDIAEATSEKAEYRANEARTETRTAKWVAIVSAGIAGLSLIVASIALFHPVTINQHAGDPVPVQIIQPAKPSK